MASASTNMKSFYRQRKTNKTGIAKPSKSKSIKKSPHTTQPTALISYDSPDVQDNYEKDEQVLKQFDMNMAYGPCLGMTRLARWERAQRLGLNPPKEIESLLKNEKAQAECLWDGRI